MLLKWILKSVWDYSTEDYVHRLILNKVDGKLVPHEGNVDESYFNRIPVEKGQLNKVEAIIIEYDILIHSQLETQEIYFEELKTKQENENELKVNELKDKCNEVIEENLELEKKIKENEAQKAIIKEKYEEFEKELKEKEKITSKLRKMKQIREKYQQNLHEKIEKTGKLYQKNQEDLKDLEENNQQKIKDLEEEVNQLMMTIEKSQMLLSSEPSEIQDSEIIIKNPNRKMRRRAQKKGNK